MTALGIDRPWLEKRGGIPAAKPIYSYEFLPFTFKGYCAVLYPGTGSTRVPSIWI